MSAATTAYLALACNDAARVAGVFESVLALSRADIPLAGGGPVPVFPLGDAALAIFEPDDARLDGPATAGVRHLALASEAPADTARSLGLAGEALDDEFRVTDAATGGVRLRFAAIPAGLPRASASSTPRRWAACCCISWNARPSRSLRAGPSAGE